MCQPDVASVGVVSLNVIYLTARQSKIQDLKEKRKILLQNQKVIGELGFHFQIISKINK